MRCPTIEKIAPRAILCFDEVRKRAPSNWYIEAEEARDLGLVLDVI